MFNEGSAGESGRGQPSWAEASMIGRREWLRNSAAQGLAAWIAGGTGILGAAFAQTAGSGKGAAGSRRTVRRPSLSTSKTKGSTATDPTSIRPDDRLNRVL